MEIGNAVAQMRSGNRVARSNWNGKNMWLAMEEPAPDTRMTLPFIYIEYPPGSVPYPNGCRVPWFASQTDLLADDWFVVT